MQKKQQNVNKTHAKVENNFARARKVAAHFRRSHSLVDGTPITERIVLGDSESLLLALFITTRKKI